MFESCGNCLLELKSQGAFQCPFHDNPDDWKTNSLPEVTIYDMAQFIIDCTKERNPKAPDITAKQLGDHLTRAELAPLTDLYMANYAWKHPRKATVNSE